MELTMARAPQRTCIGCGQKGAPASLVRLRLAEGRVAVDRDRRGGRGAWLHPDPGCLERALKRRAFARAFRAPAQADGVALAAQLTETAVRD
ncbi:MAG TPA: YlxR family protein [Anaeromyxobacteraceae bacterium]|nr:YlxR family protein [Anaeromyxobacteraceae bacterium]